jgi:hypothetical protein
MAIAQKMRSLGLIAAGLSPALAAAAPTPAPAAPPGDEIVLEDSVTRAVFDRRAGAFRIAPNWRCRIGCTCPCGAR